MTTVTVTPQRMKVTYLAENPTMPRQLDLLVVRPNVSLPHPLPLALALHDLHDHLGLSK
jgi:hypothetical protein